jgi:hypothetical protein
MPLSFKAFLSHRYKSPVVNQYFFRLFSEMAEIQFEVDLGSYAINVTRLERMIRGSDAFVGIYPSAQSTATSTSRKALLEESRYFRLELDLAIRSGKPALVLYDKRYRNLLPLPRHVLALEFDPLEITGAGGFPSEDRYRRAFKGFCEAVTASKAYEVTRPGSDAPRTVVALVLPTKPPLGYPLRVSKLILERLEAHDYIDLRPVPFPPSLDRDRLTLFGETDWALADLGEATATMAGFLHGAFIPTMRLLRVARGARPPHSSSAERALLSSTEVGYSEDILRWSDARTLERGLDDRLVSLDAPVKRLNTAKEADDYFRGASLRKEAVFFSYAGRDAAFAARLSAGLKSRFQLVFDYRDRESIRPGEAWIEEIFAQLSESAIGIPLLSESYFASGNCRHEVEDMVARRDAGAMHVIPVKLAPDPLELPAFIQNTQYLEAWRYDAVDDLLDELVGLVEERRRSLSVS